MKTLDIQPEHLAIVKSILQKNVPTLAVWAFGSRTKGKSKPYSDLDLVIITEQPMTITEYSQLAEDFSESDLPWKVDIVDWSLTSSQFKEIIQAHYIPLQ